jgi:hypothetical protein
MKIIITEKKNGYSIALIDPSILINGQPLVLKRGTAFDRSGALNCAQFINDEVQSIAEEFNEDFTEIPIVEINPLSMLQQLLFCLEESHSDELLHKHFGDDYCSYCEVINSAKSLLTDYHLQPLSTI